MLTVLYGQTRILLVDVPRRPGAQDLRPGLAPDRHARSPAPSSWAPLVALTAGLVPLGALADATSIGTLFAFALVNVAVIFLRRTRPD